MKQQINFKAINIAHVDLLLFSAFLISFFLHYRINGFIAMLIIIFYGFKLIFKKININGGWGISFLPALFLTLILGQLYSEDLQEGWSIIERNLALLFIPFAAKAIINLSREKQQILIKIFIVSGIFASLVCLGIATMNTIESQSFFVIPNNTHFLYNHFMHHRLSDPIGMHAVYFSIFLAFSNITILYILLNRKLSRPKKVLHVCIFLFIIGMLYLLKSANIAFGFTICCGIVILNRYRNILTYSKLKLTILFAGLILFTTISINNKLENFTIDYDMKNPSASPIEIRLSIWDCTWQAITDQWVLGAGTGDGHHALVEKYESNEFQIGLANDFNAHNMFLQYWLGNGILALGLFTLGLLLLFLKAIKKKNVIFISFIILFTLFSLTESTLRTQKGLFFFVFFAGLFYWNPTLWSINPNEE